MGDSTQPTQQQILDALARIIRSDSMGKASRLSALLRYVVTEELAGRGADLKAYSIGLDVLQRDSNFDPNTDSIVRVEFRRLRQALELFYLTNGKDEPVRIRLPSGTYRPKFGVAEESQVTSSFPGAGQWGGIGTSPRRFWIGVASMLAVPLVFFLVFVFVRMEGIISRAKTDTITVAIMPVEVASDDKDLISFASSLQNSLALALSHVKAFSVINVSSRTNGATVAAELAFYINADLLKEKDKLRLTVTLSGSRDKIIWGKELSYAGANLVDARDDFVKQISDEVRPQIYSAAKRELALAKGISSNAWELYIQSTWVPGEATNSLAWELQRVNLARRALRLQPDFGQAHAVLADKLSYLANVDPQSDTQALHDEADAHAARAIELAPNDPDVAFNVAIHYWHQGKLKQSAEYIKRTLELDEYNVLAKFLDNVTPYTCDSPPGGVIERAIAFDQTLSPDNPVRWVTLTWISQLAINRGDWKLAEESSQQSLAVFRTPDSFIRYSVVLLKTGQLQAARALLNEQRQNWPTLDIAKYANITMPRRCAESNHAQAIIADYADLARALQ